MKTCFIGFRLEMELSKKLRRLSENGDSLSETIRKLIVAANENGVVERASRHIDHTIVVDLVVEPEPSVSNGGVSS